MNITFTGIDEATSRRDIRRLISHRGVELAILWSPTAKGPRYPDSITIQTLLEDCEGRAAVHFCGKESRAALLTGVLHDVFDYVDRIQINGTLTPEYLDSVEAALPWRWFGTVITQHTLANASLLTWQPKRVQHALLVDNSCGRGVVPEEWVAPVTHKAVGFAGGLSPENVVEQLERIKRVARGGAWVDMESGVRTEDLFDVEKAMRVIELIIDK